jgi:hypothetical protein
MNKSPQRPGFTRTVLEHSPAAVAARRHYRQQIVSVDRGQLSLCRRELKKMPFRPEIDTSEEFGSQEKFFVPYFLALNSVNFRFWDLQEGQLRRYEAWGATGSVAMARGMSMFFHSLDPVWRHDQVSPEEVERLAVENFDLCFPSIPARSERLSMLLEVLGSPDRLHAVSKIIARRAYHYGYFSPLDIYLLMESFPLAYGQDEFCKRAQLCLMMIAERYKKFGRELLLKGFTVAADYQIPKVLRGMGILKLSSDLASTIDSGIPIPAHSDEERALRAATVIACDRLVMQSGVPMAALDYWLWSKREMYSSLRFHLTETSDY